MTIEEQLKDLILTRYRSVRDFTLTIDMPYSTCATILSNGVENANVKTIIKICKALGISADALAEGRIEPAARNDKRKTTDINIDNIIIDLKNKVMNYEKVYLKGKQINQFERLLISDYLDVFLELMIKQSAEDRIAAYQRYLSKEP